MRFLPSDVVGGGNKRAPSRSVAAGRKPSLRSFTLISGTATLGAIALVAGVFVASDLVASADALGAEVGASVSINDNYYVTISASDVDMTLSSAGTGERTTYTTNTVGLSTDAPGGVDLYLSMSGASNSLYLNGDSTSPHTIPSTAASLSLDSFASNTWGYSMDNINYQAVPTTTDGAALISSIAEGDNSQTNADVPVYYGIKVNEELPAGLYSNRLTYSAVVDGITNVTASLTSITVDGEPVEQLQPEATNVITATIGLMTANFGTPRVYLTTTEPDGTIECKNVITSANDSGYLQVVCEVTPAQGATGVTMTVTGKGSSDDIFCQGGTYDLSSSECEAGDWRWGSYSVTMPDVISYMGFAGIDYMQDMTPSVCASANTNDTGMLIDSRDDKQYWVAKLADGRCWMTQNMELDLKSRTLTSTDSDVASNYTFGSSVMYTSPSGGGSTSTTIAAWNLGDYVRTVLSEASSSTSCDTYTNLSECTSYFTDVSSMTPMTSVRTDGKAVEGTTYDAHFKTGYYYSWNAATAGSGGSITSGQAASSICPKGWELPTSSNTSSGSFYYLLSQYGLTSNVTFGSNNIALAPLYFVRSGTVYPGGSLYGIALSGTYWSSTPYSSNSYAYIFYFDYPVVEPSSYGTRQRGFSVRCIASA